MDNRLRTLWALTGSCIASGCQLWVHVDSPQCKLDQTCVMLLGDEEATCGQDGVCIGASQLGTNTGGARALPSRWSCAHAAPTGASRSVRVRVDVEDVSSLSVPPGLVGAACLLDDADCTRPVAENIAPGGDGFLQLELPYDFHGYLHLQAPDYVPVLAYDARPYTEPTSTRGPPMFSRDALEAIAAVSGGSAELASRGFALLDVRDCNDTAADGVSFDVVNGQAPFYFAGAEPSPQLTQTAISNQLSAGREPRAMGGFPALEPGLTTFRVTLPESGEVVSQVTVAIRAGHITYMRLRAGY